MNWISPTVVGALMVTVLVEEVPKVAEALVPVGTVERSQLDPESKSLLGGLFNQVSARRPEVQTKRRAKIPKNRFKE